MDPERWAEVKKLFNEALGRDAKQRAEFLDEACGHDKALRDEIASLLESHEPTSRTRLIDTLPDAADARAVDLAEGITGQRLGPYQIMREIGRGGMATVYLATRADDQFRKRAEQPDVDRQFAIDSIDERQAAAKPVVGALHLEAHHGTESRGIAFGRYVLLPNREAREIFKRQVHPPVLVVPTDVLPEVGKLQGGAGCIRQGLPLRVAVAANIKH